MATIDERLVSKVVSEVLRAKTSPAHEGIANFRCKDNAEMLILTVRVRVSREA